MTTPLPGQPGHRLQPLKEWIVAQDLYEATHEKPARLTATQKKALAVLRLPPESKDLIREHVDWVSLLSRHCQKSHAIATFSDVRTLGNRWFTTCTYSDFSLTSPVLFPHADRPVSWEREDEAMDTDAEDADDEDEEEEQEKRAVSFANKKTAKQYAAQCCCEWLVAGARMGGEGAAAVLGTVLGDGDLMAGSKRLTPTAESLVVSVVGNGQGQPPHGTQKQTTPHHPGILKTAPSAPTPDMSDPPTPAGAPLLSPTSRSNAPSGSSSPTRSLGQLIQAKAKQLSLPAPTIVLTPVNSRDDYWDGHPDFMDAAHKVPPDVGRVNAILGRKNARDMVGEKVLAWFRQVEQERAQRLREMMGLDG